MEKEISHRSVEESADRPDVGARIRAYRDRQGLSLTDLSKLTGIAASNLSSIELNKTSPTLNTLMRIASAFGKKVGVFLDEVLEDEITVVRADSGDTFSPAEGDYSVRIVTAAVSDSAFDCREITMREQSGPVRLGRGDRPTIVWCLEGTLSVVPERGGARVSLERRDSLYLRPGAYLHARSSGRSPGRLLVFTVRNGERFRE